jgi:hypothetical protein
MMQSGGAKHLSKEASATVKGFFFAAAAGSSNAKLRSI